MTKRSGILTLVVFLCVGGILAWGTTSKQNPPVHTVTEPTTIIVVANNTTASIESTVAQQPQTCIEHGYWIGAGDSFWGIAAEEFGNAHANIMMEKIAERNKMKITDTIFEGHSLIIPCEDDVVPLQEINRETVTTATKVVPQNSGVISPSSLPAVQQAAKLLATGFPSGSTIVSVEIDSGLIKFHYLGKEKL